MEKQKYTYERLITFSKKLIIESNIVLSNKQEITIFNWLEEKFAPLKGTIITFIRDDEDLIEVNTYIGDEYIGGLTRTRDDGDNADDLDADDFEAFYLFDED